MHRRHLAYRALYVALAGFDRACENTLGLAFNWVMSRLYPRAKWILGGALALMLANIYLADRLGVPQELPVVGDRNFVAIMLVTFAIVATSKPDQFIPFRPGRRAA